MVSSELFIGLMSGTSLDGVDAVLADFSGRPSIVSTHYSPYPAELRSELQRLLQPGEDELARAAVLGNAVTDRYADAVGALLRKTGTPASALTAIGCHGQTVRHRPEHGYSIQLVNGALLAEETGVAVVCDFRSRDVAAGGQGAPLVPAFHAAAFRHPARGRAVVNLGGIANITWLPTSGAVTGFDCGPGNALLDEWAERHLGRPYDEGGAWAATGQVLPDLLAALAADPYFDRLPPKSTGREYFNLTWAGTHLRPDYRPEDVQATFAEMTATVLGAAIARLCGQAEEILLCGGGAANADLVRRIERRAEGRTVTTTGVLGVDPDWVEALAFAWLAREAVNRRPGNLPEVTGACGPRVLGCIYPV